jgi:hypothetical protein
MALRKLLAERVVEGGWAIEEIDRSIEFALGADLNAGWDIWQKAPT